MSKIGQQIKQLTAVAAACVLGLSALAIPAAAAASDDFRNMQQQALYWEDEQTEEEGILSGAVLDAAGDPFSDWVAFSISRMGVEDNQAAYLYRLRETVEEMYTDLEKAKKEHLASDFCRIALTVNACGGDASSFGTDPEGNPIDLINDAVWNCIYGDPGVQGLNGYMWALAAADSSDYAAMPDDAWDRGKLLIAILSRQHADGGFSLFPQEEPDTDLTAMVLTALAPYRNDIGAYEIDNVVTGEHQEVYIPDACKAAAAFLESHIESDGTVKSMDVSNAESTGWTILALSSFGIDCASDPSCVQKNGATLLDGMKKFQLDNGGFIHSLDQDQLASGGNSMATYQALFQMEGYCRMAEGKEPIFHTIDVEFIDNDAIEAAGAKLGERRENAGSTVVGAEEAADSRNENGEGQEEKASGLSIRMIAIIAAVVLLLIVLAAFVLLHEKKDGKTEAQKEQPTRAKGKKKEAEEDRPVFAAYQEDDEDDDEEW